MVIAATFSDEVNMVTCQVAHSIFSIPRKIARLRAQSYLTAIYSDLYRRDHLPIDVVISPEREVALAVLPVCAGQGCLEGRLIDAQIDGAYFIHLLRGDALAADDLSSTDSIVLKVHV